MIEKSKIYRDDVLQVANARILEKLYHNKVMIPGACGLIGCFLVDVLMMCNKMNNADITVIAYDYKEELEDLMEDRSVKVKKISSVKKEAKNLYKVKKTFIKLKNFYKVLPGYTFKAASRQSIAAFKSLTFKQ